MLEVTKNKNSNNYDTFDISTDNGTFQITFEGNQDLYWSYLYQGSIDKVPDHASFRITKENYFIYSLFDEIKLYSDDFAFIYNASNFTIKKFKDIFIVTFTKSKTEEFNSCYFPTYSVRIRNSGSRYEPFNIPFMSMYEKLKQCSNDYHQIHIEEYLYQKRRVKRK